MNAVGLENAAAAAAELLQLCPTLCDPIDSSPAGSSVPGILQARMLKWVAISFRLRIRANIYKANVHLVTGTALLCFACVSSLIFPTILWGRREIPGRLWKRTRLLGHMLRTQITFAPSSLTIINSRDCENSGKPFECLWYICVWVCKGQWGLSERLLCTEQALLLIFVEWISELMKEKIPRLPIVNHAWSRP